MWPSSSSDAVAGGGGGGSVYLSNVDDYVSPSQACINPVFSAPPPSSSSSPIETKQQRDDPQKQASDKGGIIEPQLQQRSRRRRPRTTLVVSAAESENSNGNSNQRGASDTQPPAPTLTKEPQAENITNNKSRTMNLDETNKTTKKTKEIVQASLADCLACSGCVTTTETVLLEEQEQSLKALEQTLLGRNRGRGIDKSRDSRVCYVLTISPAAWADMVRHLDLTTASPKTSNDPNSMDVDGSSEEIQNRHLLRQLTTVMFQLLHISIVLDGNLPLTWSLQEAADEFCQSHRLQQTTPTMTTTTKADNLHHPSMEGWQRQLWPSHALSRNTLQFRSPDQTIFNVSLSSSQKQDMSEQRNVIVSQRQRQDQALPLLSSSCPAVVCMVEKTAHAAVSHLSTTKSPLSMAGAFVRTQLDSQLSIYHIAVMPCHDKKLEASRKDFVDNVTRQPDVDAVLTTTECISLLIKAMKASAAPEVTDSSQEPDNPQDQDEDESKDRLLLKQRIHSATPAPMHESVTRLLPMDGGLLLAEKEDLTTSDLDNHEHHPQDQQSRESSSSNLQSQQPFVNGSGGYADYIFRRACQELFHVVVQPGEVPWEPVSTATLTGSKTGAVRSARMAAAAQRRKEFYQATLYRYRLFDDNDHNENKMEEDNHINNGFAYTLRPSSTTGKTKYEAVLTFGLAYGMQTLQRVLKPYMSSSSSNNKLGVDTISINHEISSSGDTPRFDYVEVMACPSGCINGGGQLRVSSKETPTETRRRIAQTQLLFEHPSSSLENGGLAEPTTTMTKWTQPVHPSDARHTTYHIVPPLQLSMGAAAGMAVQDLQW